MRPWLTVTEYTHPPPSSGWAHRSGLHCSPQAAFNTAGYTLSIKALTIGSRNSDKCVHIVKQLAGRAARGVTSYAAIQTYRPVTQRPVRSALEASTLRGSVPLRPPTCRCSPKRANGPLGTARGAIYFVDFSACSARARSCLLGRTGSSAEMGNVSVAAWATIPPRNPTSS